jgi:GH35 family endo-1,4-beta-xylanase
MKNKTIYSLVIISLLLAACTPGTAVPAQTTHITATPTATSIPQALLGKAAVLYSGPGSDGYTHISELPAGTQVNPLGQFGDFTKVETTDSQDGFVITSAMADLSAPLTQLTSSEVPWQDLDLRYNFVGDGGTVQADTIKITDINGDGTNVGNGSFTLDSAFRIRMSFHLEKNSGEYASVLLMGTPPVTDGDWWRGLIRMDVGANQQNQLGICLRDGTSDQCAYETWLNIPADQPFTLLFDDPQGKVMHILDQQGQEIQKIDMATQAGVNLPKGLFPTSTLWLGAWVNPQATLYIDSFLAEKSPDGKATLEDMPELSAWVDDYIHAYGGKVTINSTEMDASQLTDAIRKGSAAFTQTKQIDNKKTSFLVVNGTPLAIQMTGEPWRKLYGRDLADAMQIDLAMPGLYSDINDPANREILANANKLTITNDLASNVVFGDFTAADWRSILDNWDAIHNDLNNGVIPNDFPYDWNRAEPIFVFAQSHNLKVRVQHLLDSGDSLPDTIYNGNFSKGELKKLLEFTASVTVLKYKGLVDEWDVEEEQVVDDIYKSGNAKYGFWMRELGLLDATELVARTVKNLDPGAKLIATEAFIVEEKLGNQEPALREHFFAFLDDLQQRGVPLDGVDIENGEWVYNPPNPEFEKQVLEQIISQGLYISAPETIVVLTPDRLPFWFEPVEKTAVVTDPVQSQAEVFRQITQTYLEVGAKGIGFGDVGDKWAFLNYSGETDANPSLFDDDSRPKQAYYAVLEVLYEHLP